MNDPIKDFVERHREEFDHLEAPVLKLDDLKAKFQHVPEIQKKNITPLVRSSWLVAASVLVTLMGVWLFFFIDGTEKPANQLAVQNTEIVPHTKPIVKASPVDSANSTAIKDESSFKQQSIAAKESVEKTPITRTSPKKVTRSVDLYAELQDSTSASTRLLAILNIEKSGKVDNQVMNMLSKTLNGDGNTNVRLAALSLMQKYSHDNYVSALLVSSLNKQDDPMVQLGLVSLLGKMKNIKIDDQLHTLADDPDTFAAVRDEAYSILLNQNKL